MGAVVTAAGQSVDATRIAHLRRTLETEDARGQSGVVLGLMISGEYRDPEVQRVIASLPGAARTIEAAKRMLLGMS